MRKKLKDTGGLTLIELLIATAILILLCLMMNTGLAMATKSYRDIIAESETQILISDLTDALADKLRYCVVTARVDKEVDGTVIKDGDGREVCTVTTSIGDEVETPSNMTVTSVGADEIAVRTTDSIGNVKVTCVGVDPTSGKLTVNNKQLLPDGAYDKGKYKVKTGDVTYNVASHSFTIDLEVKDTNLNISQTATLTVRCLSPLKKEV